MCTAFDGGAPPLTATVWLCRKENIHPGRRIKYVHGLVEQSGLAAASLDAMLFHYVTHECPQVGGG